MDLKSCSNVIDYLDNAWKHPDCQSIVRDLNRMNLKQFGIEGPNDPYYF